MYHCKDLNHIAFSPGLWNRINNKEDIDKIKTSFINDLKDYYKEMDGLPNINDL